MNSAAHVSYIRQLCCLGLGGQIIMSELLRALHGFIPSTFNIFLWSDDSHQIRNVYSENSEDWVQPLHLGELSNPQEVHSYPSMFSKWMCRGQGRRNFEQVGHQFWSSDPPEKEGINASGTGHCVEVTVSENGRGYGSLVLHRTQSDKPFTSAEEMRLRGLIPYLAHGLRGSRDVRGELTASGESGTLIVDAQDQIVQFCPEGKRLLRLATHNGLSETTGPSLNSSALKLLCANLRCALQRPSQQAPTQRLRNAWGEFVFRAYPLSTDGNPDGSIAVVVERHEPMPIALMRTMRTLPVSARQREVCLLLSYGYTHSMIGERMHVSKHTATDYVRKIYDKLDVRSQDQLMKKLKSIYVY